MQKKCYDGCCDAPSRSPFREEGLIPQLLRVVLVPMDISLAEEILIIQSHTPSQSNPHLMTGPCWV